MFVIMFYCYYATIIMVNKDLAYDIAIGIIAEKLFVS